MGKISPVSAKYIIHANIHIDGVVEKPDVIGAIFGQTEGLLGPDLELRELQKSGRIGRIEVNVEIKNGKTLGTISLPSSLDKAETAIIAASLEIIQRIGPCNAKVQVTSVEDVRISKRRYVIDRAKELLKKLIEEVMPDSQDLSDEVAYSVRMMEVQEYGRERLPAGPNIDDSDDIIVVEGRADVLNLLKHGFKNAIAINGTSVPQTIADLSRRKTVTVFVDGDRGGDLIIRELFNVAEIDFVAKAPDGKEVEEITKKEIHKSLRARITGEQYLLDIGGKEHLTDTDSRHNNRNSNYQQRNSHSRPPDMRKKNNNKPSNVVLTDNAKKVLKDLSESLLGTRGACILDNNLKVLGKVPLTELQATLRNINNGVYAVILDGTVDRNLVRSAERSNVKVIVGNDIKVRPQESRLKIMSMQQLLQ